MTPPFDIADLLEGSTRTEALHAHFAGNMFPAVNRNFTAAALAAIREVDAYRPGTPILMPGGKTRTAGEIVSALRIDSMCDSAGDELYADRVEAPGKLIDCSG